MSQEVLTAFHFVADTLRDGRPVPADGELLVHDGEVRLCAQGLHASIDAFDALQYAPGNTLCLVELSGTIIRGDDKVAASERRIIKRIDAEPLMREFARWSALQVIELWDAPEVVRQYLTTGDEPLRADAWAAARSAARSDAWAAAWAAAWDAAWDDAWDDAWAAARSAARSDAWAAARSAARSDAWAAARSAARSAARAAAWAAAWDAAWDDAWAAARSAARSDAWAAARSAARSAARAAAWAAAWDAAWDAQRERFNKMVRGAFCLPLDGDLIATGKAEV